MSVTKVINVKVNDSDLDELNPKLERTGNNIERIESGAEDADGAFKKLGDNGGAISTLDAFTGGLATRIRDGAEATKVFNFQLRATRTALIATGVGAFVIALAAIAIYWEDIVDFVQKTNKALERQINILDRKATLLESELKLLELQEELLGLQGESTEEIRVKRREMLNTQLALNQAQLANLTIQQEQLRNDSLRVGLLDLLRTATTGQPLSGSIDEDESSRIKEAQDRINQLKQSIVETEIAIASLDVEDRERRNQPRRGADQDEVSALPITGLTGLEQLETITNAEIDILTNAELLITEMQKRQAQERLDARAAELEQKDQLIQAEAGLLNQFSGFLSIFGEENKALAIASIVTEQIASAAQIISSTGVANAKAIAASPLTGGQPWVTINTASAGLAIASGVAASAKAISQLGGGGSVGGIDSGPNSTTAPAFNIVDDNPDNQLNNALLNQSNNPQQVFVTEGSVTNAQEIKRKKVRSTSL